VSVVAVSCRTEKPREADIMAMTACYVVFIITVAAAVAAPPGGKFVLEVEKLHYYTTFNVFHTRGQQKYFMS
jgi:hypothetical protein